MFPRLGLSATQSSGLPALRGCQDAMLSAVGLLVASGFDQSTQEPKELRKQSWNLLQGLTLRARELFMLWERRDGKKRSTEGGSIYDQTDPR